MKLTKTLDQDIAQFEKATGKAVSPKLRKLIAALAATGDQFENMGVKDAASGRQQRTRKDFVEWGRRDLSDTEGKDNPIVDLMYQCYLDGYSVGRTAE